jgi:uncharacterized caspase-like protein
MTRALRKIFLSLLLLLAACCLSAGDASAEKRVALIIGNSAYDKVARLPNPANDAALIAETFKSAGFDSVELRRDLKIGDMRRALRDFIDKAREADIAVIYYAGHGIEVDGTNYLVPADAVLERDVDIYDEALSLDRVLVSVEPAKQLRLVILDACRDNPFTRSMKRTLASRAVGRGLAKVEPTSPNTLIAYASKAGSTASDGDGKNSPFTTALVKHVTKPGLDLRKAFGYVRDDVLKSTGNRQEPYVYGSLGGDDVPLVPAKPVATGPQADPGASIRKDYELAMQLRTREVWEAFLRTYPDGFYAELAKGQLKKVAAEEARTAAVEKVRQAEQEKARLAAEGARQAEMAKAEAAAKAAEQARIAAEKAKQIEQEKAAAAERARVAEQEKARIAAEKAKQAEQEKAAAADQARLAAEKAAAEKKEQLAALAPPAEKSEQPAADLPRALQSELRRVGCNTGAVDGSWSAASQKALDLFNKHAGMKLDVRTASADALDAVKGKTGRICPLVCETGYRADGDRCVKIACRAGYQVNDDGACEKIETRKPVAKREEPKPRRETSERAKPDAAPAKPQASGGQYICGQAGCRPVRQGCRLATTTKPGERGSSGTASWTIEVCN